MGEERPAGKATPVALAFGGMAALAAGMGVGRFVYTPILPAMAEALGLTGGEAGLIAAANFVGYLAGALLAAAPRLPGSRRTWLLGALAAGAATTGAMGLVSSLPAFSRSAASAARPAPSCSSSPPRSCSTGSRWRARMACRRCTSPAWAWASRSRPRSFRRCWPPAPGGAPFGSRRARPRWPPWRPWPCWCPGASRRGRQSRPFRARQGGAGRGLATLAWAYGLFGFGYVVTATFLVVIVRADPGVRPVEPLVWAVVGVAAAPSVALWARLATRLDVARAFAVACLVEAAGVAASVLWPTAVGALLAAALLGGTFMGITALGLAGQN